MRRQMTAAELKLWQSLRAHRLEGLSFRRQVPIGPYIVDFVCHERRLIIEVDGGQHADSQRDRQRDAMLADKGYRTLRFWNSDVFENCAGVLETILDAASCDTPLPNPPPQGGRGPSSQ